MSRVTHLDHIAIVTHSLSESLHFFEKQLGITCTHIEELADRGIRVAMLPIGDTRIELIEPLHDQSEISSFLEKRGSGIHHLAFGSQNIADDMQEMQKQGVRFTTSNPTRGAHGAQVGFVHPKSAGGVLIELSSAQNLKTA